MPRRGPGLDPIEVSFVANIIFFCRPFTNFLLGRLPVGNSVFYDIIVVSIIDKIRISLTIQVFFGLMSKNNLILCTRTNVSSYISKYVLIQRIVKHMEET